MNTSVKKLFDYKIQAEDGEIGSVHDVLFDEQTWKLRYFVVETGGWLFGRNVLISPLAVGTPDANSKHLPVALTKEQIKHSPDIAIDLPLNRDQEANYHDYYRWPYYWGGSSLAGAAYGVAVASEAMVVGDTRVMDEDPRDEIPADKRDQELRSCRELLGYGVRAGDHAIGKIDDFFFDAGECSLPFAILQLEQGDKRIVMPVTLIGKMGPPGEVVEVGLTPDVYIGAPAYDDSGDLHVEEATRHYTRAV